MENKQHESIEVVKINIQIMFNDKSVKNCEVPHEVLVKIADILYQYEDQKDKENKTGIYKE
jgi:hypothetical protein